MPDDTKNRNRLSLEERLVMRETEIDILLATIHEERARTAKLRKALDEALKLLMPEVARSIEETAC